MSGPLAAFLQRVTPAQRASIAPAPAEIALQNAFATGQQAWPQLSLSATELAAHLGDCFAEHTELDLASIEQLCLADLFLAAACALGRTPAIACFRATHLCHIEGTLRGLGVRPSEIDELAQVVLDAMLVGDDGEPAIARYSGRGTLRRWVRSVAIRSAAKRHRSEKHDAVKQARLGDVVAELDDDLELEHIKRRYAPEFEAALEAAIATLDVRERNLLRHYFIDGLTVDEIGRLFDVHRSTAARWVAKARELLHARVLEHLQHQLGLSPKEVDSMGRFVRSRVDFSFSRLLRQ